MNTYEKPMQTFEKPMKKYKKKRSLSCCITSVLRGGAPSPSAQAHFVPFPGARRSVEAPPVQSSPLGVFADSLGALSDFLTAPPSEEGDGPETIIFVTVSKTVLKRTPRTAHPVPLEGRAGGSRWAAGAFGRARRSSLASLVGHFIFVLGGALSRE